jgi:hypothetical protein
LFTSPRTSKYFPRLGTITGLPSRDAHGPARHPRRDEYENVLGSIRFDCELDSNEIDESHSQYDI